MTQPAIGIHDHPELKLGVRPNDPTKVRLAFGDFLVSVPDHPIEDPAPNLNYPMDKNDEWGDCVVAGGDHASQVINAAFGLPYTNMTEAQLLADYHTQNPTFDPNSSFNGPGTPADGGMNIQEYLAYLVKTGRILGFAAVPLGDREKMRAAVYLGLALMAGADLTVAQQDQGVWDYVAGSPGWGGHCFVSVGYNAAGQTEVTWGQLKAATDAFFKRQVGELWFVLTKAHVDHPTFRNHFDLSGFAAAFTQITDRPFPVPITPTPAPTPVPAPVVRPIGVDTADAQLVLVMNSWAPNIISRFTKAGKVKAAYQAWKQAKGL